MSALVDQKPVRFPPDFATLYPQPTGRFRHVVFADAINGSSRALDFAPNSSVEENLSVAMNADEGNFVEWLFRRAGLNASHYRPESFARRLPACLRTLRVGNVDVARALLLQSPELIEAAVNAMLLGVTSFFRDTTVFDSLARRVLPDFLARRAGRSLRVWSVGCSDGAELYSVAMLLVEAGVVLDDSVHLLGTDCRSSATRRAVAGSYDASAVSGLSTDRLHRFFNFVPGLAGQNMPGDAGQWQIRPEVQRQCHWRTADMLQSVEPGPWDLILCRNVSMYLRASACTTLWPALVSGLDEGGYFVLGKAERPSGTTGLSCVENCIYRRH